MTHKQIIFDIARKIIENNKCISKKQFYKRLKKECSFSEDVYSDCYTLLATNKEVLIEQMELEFNIVF